MLEFTKMHLKVHPYLGRSHAAVPECDGVGLVLEPVGQINRSEAEQLSNQATQSSIDIPLAGNGKA